TSVPVELGVGGVLNSWPMLVFVVGLLVTAALVARRVRGAILIGIVGMTIVAIIVEAIVGAGGAVGPDGQPNPGGWRLNVPQVPAEIFSLPDFSLLGQFSLFGA